MFTITVERTPLRVAFEVDSLDVAINILADQDAQLRKIISTADELNDTTGLSSGTASGGETLAIQTGGERVDEAKAEDAKTEAKKRGRPAKDKTQDPATANAPAPVAIPGVGVDLTPNANGIPAAFDRTATAATAAASPPPPPPPPAAPPPPPAPPSGILAGRVIENLNARNAGSADGGASLATWLAAYEVVAAGATYDEAIAAIRLMPDDKLARVATALEVK